MTGSCEHCRELLWDLVYDLLDAEQARAVWSHVKGCAACQAVLNDVEAKQKRIAAVARLATDVPAFVAPTPEPAILPFPARPARRSWGTVAAAAALFLVAVGLPYGLYALGVQQRSAALASARATQHTATDERQRFQDQAATAQDDILTAARSRHPRMQVVGPAAYQPGMPSAHEILVTDLNGQPIDADVTARVLAADQRELLNITRRTTAGTLVVALPPDLAAGDSPLRLDFTAAAAHGRVQIQDSLPVRGAEWVTHLAVSKLLGQPGDVIFFRSVTLDRFTLTPAREPLELRYTLAEPTGRIIWEGKGSLAEGGIGGGAFELPQMGLKQGAYVLTVAEAQGRFLAQTRVLHIHANRPIRLKKVLTFDQPFYRPGDMLQATIRAHRLKGGAPVAAKPVRANLKIDGESTDLQVRGTTDAEGVARLQLRLPDKLGQVPRLTVVIMDENPAEVMEQDIPLDRPGLVVEFFPEGGELLAGVPNRVYCRARTKQRRAAVVEGAVVDGQGREVATLRMGDAGAATAGSAHGLGMFTVTPAVSQHYALRLREGEAPVPLPSVRRQGIALSTPSGVLEAGQTVPVVLHVAGAARNVVVTLTCRGRLVAQEAVAALTGRKEVRLVPPSDLGGVFRVTVFEDDGELRPAAERLVYRVPSERLNLNAEVRRQLTPAGEKVSLSIQAAREDGRPVSAWLLVSAVDLDSAGQTDRLAGPSVRALFQLLGDVRRPEDLEDADFLLKDVPEARARLDLFLGTQGWRRFTDPNLAGQPEPPADQGPNVALVTKLDSAAESWRRLEAEVVPALTALQARTRNRDQELLAAQEAAYEAATAASAALVAFDAWTATALRWILIGALVALCVVGGFVIVPAVRRTWPQVALASRPYLGGALAAVLVGCALLWGFVQTRVDKPMGEVWGNLPKTVWWTGTHVEGIEAVQTPVRQEGAVAAVGNVAQPILQPEAAQLDSLLERRSYANGIAEKRIWSTPVGAGTATIASVNKIEPEKPSQTPARIHAPREYAYLPAPDAQPARELPDTVLWHPALHAADGRAAVEFVLPRRGATYQIMLQGHTSTGRLSATRLELKAAGE